MAINRTAIHTTITGEKAKAALRVVKTNLTPTQRLSVLCVQTKPTRNLETNEVDGSVDVWTEILSPMPVDPTEVDVRTGDVITINNVRGRESKLTKTVALWGNAQVIGRYDRKKEEVQLFALAGKPAASPEVPEVPENPGFTDAQ